MDKGAEGSSSSSSSSTSSFRIWTALLPTTPFLVELFGAVLTTGKKQHHDDSSRTSYIAVGTVGRKAFAFHTKTQESAFELRSMPVCVAC